MKREKSSIQSRYEVSKFFNCSTDFFLNFFPLNWSPNLQAINILKAHGQSVRDSYLLNGYALNTGRAAQGMPLRVSPARIACLDINLQKSKMQMGVQVLVSDPKELEKIRDRYSMHWSIKMKIDSVRVT